MRSVAFATLFALLGGCHVLLPFRGSHSDAANKGPGDAASDRPRAERGAVSDALEADGFQVGSAMDTLSHTFYYAAFGPGLATPP